MTTTSHDEEQPKQADLESTTDAAAASTDTKRVPLGEHVELRQQLRAEKEARAALEKRLADAEKRSGSDSQTQESSSDLASTVREIQHRERLRDVQAELGLGRKAAEKVLDLVSKMPGLTTEEARTIAANRDPELFNAEDDTTGYQPGVHGVSRPRPGSSPQPEFESDTPKRLEHIAKLTRTNKKAAESLMNNLIGSIASQQVGRKGHKRVPLPRSDQ